MTEQDGDLPVEGAGQEHTGPPLSIQGEETEYGPGDHPAADDDTPPDSGRFDDPEGDGYVTGYDTTGTRQEPPD